MHHSALSVLHSEIGALEDRFHTGRVAALDGIVVRVAGLSMVARLGDRLIVQRSGMADLEGEVIRLSEDDVTMLPDEVPNGLALGQRVRLGKPIQIMPDHSWIGRVVDPLGRPIDGRALLRGHSSTASHSTPPPPAKRRALGDRLETGMSIFNTMLPIVRGQRMGIFAGSGVGKTQLLGHLGRHMQADIVVFALVGERGRELREFIEDVLGPEGMARSIIVAATSDCSALQRRRSAWTAMQIAEHFRDEGKQVLLLVDSVTRFAEAHREVATAAGELPALRGFPASTAHMIMSLCERAGPGVEGSGDITALFSVLVAGSDMEEPIADILRGVLDGHIVLDRAIAERGRFPAIDVLRSVSRSLPRAASLSENETILRARRVLGAYTRSETMVKAGLYAEGSDPDLDQAIRAWPELDKFIGEPESGSIQNSFDRLGLILRRASQTGKQIVPQARGQTPSM